MAACSWNGPTRPRGSASSRSATPRATCSASQAVRSRSARGTSTPPRTRVAARASVSSMSARRPAVSGSRGSARCTRSVSLIASAVRPRSIRCAPDGTDEPVVNRRCSTWRTACNRVGSSCAATGPKGASTPASLALARLIRCAAVLGGSKRPAATCWVVSPHTARSVSATAEPGLSAGWQHSSSRCTESSWSRGWSLQDAQRCCSSTSSRLDRAASERWLSTRRRDATRTSHPRGLPGTPSTGHCALAATSASCAASSQSASPAPRRSRAARTWGASRRHTSSIAAFTGALRPRSPAA